MYLSTAIVLLGGSGGLLVPAAQHYRRYASLSPGSRRDLQTCNQTYGTGFVACGNSSSVMCFNPSQGQVRERLASGWEGKKKQCSLTLVGSFAVPTADTAKGASPARRCQATAAGRYVGSPTEHFRGC